MLVEEVFKPLGVNIQYEELPRRRLIHSGLRGDISIFTLPVLDNPIVNIQVPEGIILGDQALFSYPLNFYALKRRQISLEKPEDVVEYSLGVIKEAKFIDAAISRVVNRELSLVTFQRPRYILKALLAERVDIIMLAEPIFQYELSKLKTNEEISLAYSIGRSGRHLAFSEASLGKEKALQLKAFTNRRLQDLKDKGVLQKIAQDYLNTYDEPSED
ncbi:hypothetical protein [Maricurvus nonylphenolicus]|uniref:hypothetical protein n=1 Tax=Maricurvus nonylphenolicus TaxID=1008307 RepID=UPI0036F40113